MPPDPGLAPPLWQLLQAAARVVQGVGRGRSVPGLLDAVEGPLRGGTHALVLETLRHLGAARALRAQLAPKRPAPALDALLRVALALLLPQPRARLGYAEFTVVDQAVEASRRLRGAGTSQARFVNACLRRFLREREALMHALADDPVARWNHPAWWVQRLQQDHPSAWQGILTAAQYPAPLDLRLNSLRTTLVEYQALLQGAGIAHEVPGPGGIRLPRSRPMHEIPGHSEGLVSVQSLAAQQAAPLLLDGLRQTQAPRILDACAAPGGKTAHLLELCPDARVVALDHDAARSARIHQNLERLGLGAEVLVADAATPDRWWDGQPFDAILLDVPCSASGIAGRHPDVRWLRRAGDIAQLARRQDALLQALWPLLAPGGRMLYCSCSAFRAEGEERVQAFVSRHPDAVRLPAPGHRLPPAFTLSPDGGDNAGVESDCFFYALLERQAEAGAGVA